MTDASHEIRIQVDGATAAEANELTGALQRFLRENAGLSLARERQDQETQDAGSILIAVLSAPTIVALAHKPAERLAEGIAKWLATRRATLKIGNTKIENVSSEAPERIILKAIEAGLVKR